MHIAAAIALDTPSFTIATARPRAAGVPAAPRRAARSRWADTGEGRGASIAAVLLAVCLAPVTMGAFAQAFVL